MTRFLGLVGKPGSGKTTVAINLAQALYKHGRDVLLLDANITNPHVGLYLGRPEFKKNLHSSLAGRDNIRDSIYLHETGIRLVGGDLETESLKYADNSNLAAIFEKLKGMAEIVIVDFPNIGDDFSKLLNNIDEAVIVANPDIVCATDTIRISNICEEANKPVLGVILNKSGEHKQEMSEEQLDELFDYSILEKVPYSKEFMNSMNSGSTIIEKYPDSDASVIFKKLGAKLIGRPYENELPKKDKNMLMSFLESIRKG